MVRHHKTTVLIPSYQNRGRSWNLDNISNQFRFLIRQAVALHDAGLPYTLDWRFKPTNACNVLNDAREHTATSFDLAFGATLECFDLPFMPPAKQLPKEKTARVKQDWKPRIFECEYRLEAFIDKTKDNKLMPGFVAAHSCGLSLVKPSDTGELTDETNPDSDSDMRQGWFIVHTQSGLGFGITTTFQKATAALLMAAEGGLDWSRPISLLEENYKRVNHEVIAKFGNSQQKASSRTRLEAFARAEAEAEAVIAAAAIQTDAEVEEVMPWEVEIETEVAA